MEKILRRDISITSLITTDYVLDETITLIKFAHSHEKAVEFAEASLKSLILKIVFTERDPFIRAFELFKKSRDKEWSFTDCVSFTVMKDLGVVDAFSFDSHFQQMGFKMLP